MKTAALAAAFGVELAALAAFAWAGWQATTTPWRWLLAAVAAGIAAAVWGVFMAPRSPRRLRDPALFAAMLIFFAAAAAALSLTGHPWLGAVLFVVAVANAVAVRRWEVEAPG